MFDTGLNTISGTLGVTDAAVDLDSFAFIIPNGLQLLSTNVTLSDLAGDVTSAAWEFNSGSTSSSSGTVITQFSVNSPGFRTISSTPLGAGLYNLTQIGLIYPVTPSTASHVFEFKVAPVVVPEPASLAVMCLGATVLLKRRR